jgi:CO dehydrogenase/acetyl-CoA synthase epsilon subunit
MDINGIEAVVCPVTDRFLQRLSDGSVLNILAIPNDYVPAVLHRVTCVTDEAFLSLLDKLAGGTN